MLHLLLSVALQSAPAPVLDLPPACFHAGRCGECYDTGKAGTRSADNLDCNPCEFAKPDKTIADRNGIPGPREPKKRPYLTASYTPPNNGGPVSTGGSSTRWM